jgi:hypothetical protein
MQMPLRLLAVAGVVLVEQRHLTTQDLTGVLVVVGEVCLAVLALAVQEIHHQHHQAKAIMVGTETLMVLLIVLQAAVAVLVQQVLTAQQVRLIGEETAEMEVHPLYLVLQ